MYLALPSHPTEPVLIAHSARAEHTTAKHNVSMETEEIEPET